MDVGTRDAETAVVFWPAARTRAVRFYGGEVVGEGRVAEIQGSGGNDGVAEALGDARHQWVGDWVDWETDYVRRFLWARHSRTCRLPGRRRRGDLRGSRRPLRSVVCSGGANWCRHLH